jgi:hypothetical protein
MICCMYIYVYVHSKTGSNICIYIYIYIKNRTRKMMCLCCDINRTCLLRADRVECEWIIDVRCGYIYKALKQKNKRVCVVCADEKTEEIKSGCVVMHAVESVCVCTGGCLSVRCCICAVF